MTDHLFVYGSLRRAADGGDHPLLRGAATFVGTAACRGRLYDLGPYPGAAPSGDPKDQIRGDLYLMHDPVQTLARLDRYEGDAYRREVVEAARSDGVRRAWIYFFEGPLEHAVRLPSGDYRDR